MCRSEPLLKSHAATRGKIHPSRGRHHIIAGKLPSKTPSRSRPGNNAKSTIADDCLVELRWLYDRRNAEEARRDLAAWLLRWQEKYPKLCAWVEENIEETFTFYRLPREHHKHLKSTNMLERLNQELKRRTHVIRIFPNPESCLRLIRALAVEIHEGWLASPCC